MSKAFGNIEKLIKEDKRVRRSVRISFHISRADSDIPATFFIEYLAKFDDKESVERIGRIYKKVLENNTLTFRQEDIESIVRKIYKKGKRKDAEDICNTYGRRGIHFLKPVWEEFRVE